MPRRKPTKAKLTKRVVDAAIYTGAERERCIVYDTELAGFGLRIYPTGKKAFVLRYTMRGSRTKRLATIGTYGVITVDQARDEATTMLLKVRAGEDPLEPDPDPEPDVPAFTVKDLLDRWINEYAKHHRKRWQECQHHIDKHLAPEIGDVPAVELTRTRCRELHSKIGAKARTQANRSVETLRAAYNWAARWEVIPETHPNPAIVQRFKETRRKRWLAPREVVRLAAAINRDDDLTAQAAIRLLLLTGCRRTELLRARWDRLDLDGRRLLLEDTKTGEAKVVPLSAPAMDIVRDLPRHIDRTGPSPWMFPSPKNPRKPMEGLKRPWARIRKRAKLPDVRIHDLRRTTGSWLIQRGVSEAVIGDALGHRDRRATRVYTEIAAQQPAEALEMLGEAFGRAVRSRKRA